MNHHLTSELSQLEHYNQYLAGKCREKILSLIDKKLLLETKTANKGHGGMFNRDSKEKQFESACNAIRDFVGKKFCFKGSDQETLPQHETVDAP